MPWIYVGLLEVGEDQLAGGGIITVGPKKHIWELELSRY